MTDTIRRFAIWALRAVITIFITAIVLSLAAWILGDSMSFVATEQGPRWLQAIAAAILIGLINLLLRPIVLWISRPLGFFVLFIVGFLLNVAALLLASWLLPGFVLSGFFAALLASILVAIVNVILASVLHLSNETSYYRDRIVDAAVKTRYPEADAPQRKLVMMEIDGLSYHHLHKALEEGLMPTMQEMMKDEGYVLSLVDCGIPSQTSACQAGILFGDNDDIPAFRWFDKTQGKLIVSSSDAGELNERYAHGNGLLRGGTSVSNMLNGDAYKSLMTASDLRTPDKEEGKRRAEDVYLLMLDPNFLINTLARYLGMVVVEVWEGWQQRRNDVEPRLNRLAHFYPFVRAATSVILRELGAAFTMMDIVRGSPSIYVTWPGYDEVAHHSGPWTGDAFNELARYDDVIARVRQTIKEEGPGHYDLIILSDHGQSFGPTFLQRYGVTIKEFIEQQLPAGTTVSAAIGGDTGAMSLNSVGAELSNAQSYSAGSRTAERIAKQGAKLADRATAEEVARIAAATIPADVTAYGSGNLAQVYFNLFPRKITLTELNAAYPGMVDALVQHEGIGLVCGYLDDGTPIAMGKKGTRNLHSGEIEGEDPLLMYAPATGYGASTVETRAWQVQRVMDFPHAGDLMVISTVYEDGTVAALEELIGNHGGLGGEQTDAFMFHPPDLDVPATRNSIDVFHVLNDFRGTPAPPAPVIEEEEAIAEWAPANLWKGLTMVGTWLEHVFRCLIPDKDAFVGVVQDPLMTGPAILLGVLGTLAFSWVLAEDNIADWLMVVTRLGGFLIGALALFGAGYLLTRRGSFSETVRVLGFAQSPALLLILTLYEPLRAVFIFLATLLVLVGVWVGSAVAFRTKGWQTAVLPFIYLLVVMVGSVAAAILASGVALTLESILSTLGIGAP